MRLKDSLVSIAAREKSGADTSRRYDYQKNWALCQILEKHKTGDDYLFIFEHHDDVLMLDSEIEPREVCFYQIKSKDSGHWSMSKLLERKRGKDGTQLFSYVGKMYDNKIKFQGQTKSLNFVSNARFNFNLKPVFASKPSLSKTTICAKEIEDDELSKIKDQLVAEHALKELPEFEDITFFIATDLSLGDHEKHTKGKLSDFLETTFSERNFKVGPIHRTVFDEIRRKNNYSEDINSFDELVKHKSIGRSRFEEILQTIGVQTDFDEAWATFEARLNVEGFPFGQLLKIKNEWRRCEVDRMDSGNLVIQRIVTTARTAVQQAKETKTLSSLVTEASLYCEQNLQKFSTLHSSEYIMAMVLMEYYEQQLPATDSKS
jgi:hypothetical protein